MSGRFRSQTFPASGAATVALLGAMEGADLRRRADPGDAVHDGGTAARFGAAMAVAVSASSAALLAPANRPVPSRPARWWAGLALVWSGAALNRSARAALGRSYRSMVTVVDGHQVVDRGPYRLVRHPMYTGSALICAGLALTVDHRLASPTWALPVAALVRRITVEERVLEGALGSRYAEFAGSRARLVPGVW